MSREDAVTHLTSRLRVLAVDVQERYLLEPPPEHGRIRFHRLNIKNDSRLEGLIKMSDLVIPWSPFSPDSPRRSTAGSSYTNSTSRTTSDSKAIKMLDLTINLTTICIPADYNTRSQDTLYSNFVDALRVVKYCSENNKWLIHFSTCEVYENAIQRITLCYRFCKAKLTWTLLCLHDIREDKGFILLL